MTDLRTGGTLNIVIGLIGLMLASVVYIPSFVEATKLDIQCVEAKSLERLGYPQEQSDGICPTGSYAVVYSNGGDLMPNIKVWEDGDIDYPWLWFLAGLCYILICMLCIAMVWLGFTQHRVASGRERSLIHGD